MTREDEEMVRYLSTRAAVFMNEAASMAAWPHESTSDLLDSLETMDRCGRTAAQLITAALALADV